MSKTARRVFISGQVQGVGFRESTVREAGRFPGLGGFVKNLSDGRVEAVFLGEERAVLELVSWCRHGPTPAKVSRLEVFEEFIEDILVQYPGCDRHPFARQN